VFFGLSRKCCLAGVPDSIDRTIRTVKTGLRLGSVFSGFCRFAQYGTKIGFVGWVEGRNLTAARFLTIVLGFARRNPTYEFIFYRSYTLGGNAFGDALRPVNSWCRVLRDGEVKL